MEQLVVSSIGQPHCYFLCSNWNWKRALGAATLDDFGLYGGTVQNLAITTEGKFYTSAPTVTISHPGTSFVSATIGIAGSSIDPGSVAFTTTGRSYTTAPTVAITTSGSMVPPTVQAVGIAYDSPNHRYCYCNLIQPIRSLGCWNFGNNRCRLYRCFKLSFSGNPSPVQCFASNGLQYLSAGTVTSLSIGNSGFGYQSTPTVTISAPAGVTTQFTALVLQR